MIDNGHNSFSSSAKMKIFFTLSLLLALFYTATSKPHYSSSRCVNVWDDGCTNGQLPGAGDDDDYLNGGFNPGKRCINMWDEGCVNGQLQGSGGDDDYLNGGFNPGKRSLGEVLATFMKLQRLRHH